MGPLSMYFSAWMADVKNRQRLMRLEKLEKRGVESEELVCLLNDLGDDYLMRRQYEKAEPLFCRALEVAEKLFGSSHLDIAIILSNLAEIYTVQNRYGEAEAYLRRAIQIEQQEVPAHKESLLNTFAIRLGDVLILQQKYKESITLLTHALEREQDRPQPEERVLADLREALGEACRQAGDTEHARIHLEKAFALKDRLYGMSGPHLLRVVHGLIALNFEQEETDKALSLLQMVETMDDFGEGAEQATCRNYLEKLMALCQVHQQPNEVILLQGLLQSLTPTPHTLPSPR